MLLAHSTNSEWHVETSFIMTSNIANIHVTFTIFLLYQNFMKHFISDRSNGNSSDQLVQIYFIKISISSGVFLEKTQVMCSIIKDIIRVKDNNKF